MISVIVPTLDEAEALAASLISLGPAVIEGALREVIVADGGSVDETAEIAEATGARLIAGPADLGPRLGQAVDASRGRWLAFLSPGVRLPEGWVDQIRNQIDTSPDIAAWAPMNVEGLFARVVGGFSGPAEGFVLAPRGLVMNHRDALSEDGVPAFLAAIPRASLDRLPFAIDRSS